MKTTSDTHRIFGLILPALFVISAQMLSAQDDQKKDSRPMGFVRIANAVAPGTGNVKVKIDVKDIYAPGYKFGAVTGGVGLRLGGHSITFSREGVKEGTTKVEVAKDQTITLIPFAERVPATDQEPAHFEIRIVRLKQKEVPTGRSASFISVSGQPEIQAEIRAPAGSWEKISVKRFSISEATIHYPEGYVPIRVNGKVMPPIPIGTEGNYVVVIYDDPNGIIQTSNFRDFKYLSAD